MFRLYTEKYNKLRLSPFHGEKNLKSVPVWGPDTFYVGHDSTA